MRHRPVIPVIRLFGIAQKNVSARESPSRQGAASRKGRQQHIVVYSNALSLGALYSAFISSDIGMFRLRPLGGIGLMNHLA